MPKPIIQGPYRTFRRLNPGETFLEYEGSTITIPMRGRRGADGAWIEDEIKLKAFMRLEVFPPYVNNLLTREFQFIIRDWYLYGKSPMLNELFFGDPRGILQKDAVTGQEGFVPAVVTFNVSNNYEPSVLAAPGAAVRTADLFGPVGGLEIRNLTSHHLRGWERLPEKSASPVYTLPGNTLFWTILSGEATEALAKRDPGVRALLANAAPGPSILFHTRKPTRNKDRVDVFDFDPLNAEQRYAALLAIGTLTRDDGVIHAVAPPPFELHRVQLPGNTVLSPLDLPRQPLEIRWQLAKPEGAKLANHRAFTLKGGERIDGAIRIVSPARSLGTADFRPDPGDPIDSADFPARITYAINYSIAVNRERFVEDQAGVAIAVGALEIPPRDVTVAFDKPHVGHVLQQYLEFGPGHCTGMHEITVLEYEAGVNFARYWRTVRLDPGQWKDFRDYDPAKVY
jgi:hypothetical protein